MVSLYVTIFIVMAMVAYAGTEETLRAFRYLELTVRYQWIRLRMYFMARKIKRELDQWRK